MLDTLNRAFDLTNRVLGYVSAAFVVVMAVTVLYDVLARMTFAAPTIWVIDINEYLLVYLCFVPAAWILMNDHHVKVEIVTARLSPASQGRLRVVTDFLGFIYCVVLAWQGWLVAWHAFENGYRFSTALNLPKFPVLVIIPIGAAWLALGFVVRILTGSRAQTATTPEKGGL
ncbi:MAG: TRAP transporter small permease [Deltaproteobacteria bacterium]|nr:TRAP transporter small permease [Deltaproteobacteria bacterium]